MYDVIRSHNHPVNGITVLMIVFINDLDKVMKTQISPTIWLLIVVKKWIYVSQTERTFPGRLHM